VDSNFISSLTGTFSGVLLGAFFTYRFGLLVYRKQQKVANNLIRRERVYEPLFEDLKYIQEYLTRSLDPHRQYTHSEDPPLSFYTWNQIKSDKRIWLVNNKHIEDNCNRVEEQITNYHLSAKNIREYLGPAIKKYIKETFDCEMSKDFDASHFLLSITDRRYPLQRAFDDLFSPGSFPDSIEWESIKQKLDNNVMEDVQNQLLTSIDYPKLFEDHANCIKRVLRAVDSTNKILVKEIRKIIKESEG